MGKIAFALGIVILLLGFVFQLMNLAGPGDAFGLGAIVVGIILLLLAGVTIPPRSRMFNIDLPVAGGHEGRNTERPEYRN